MKQHDAVIQALDRLGGQSTLADLYVETMKIRDCEWKTKTPFASIRRIVQTRPEIFRIRPGLWALRSYQKKLGLVEGEGERASGDSIQNSHTYFQGLLVTIGNFRAYQTFVPNQDKNRLFINKPLAVIRTLQELPAFSYDFIVRKSGSVDVIWFNDRQMPDSFFEVEHSTDIHNSLIKFADLQDFNSRMVIVADEHRLREYDDKLEKTVFKEIKNRIKFLGYNALVKEYEHEVLKSVQPFAL
jgi:hypothetical protein